MSRTELVVTILAALILSWAFFLYIAQVTAPSPLRPPAHSIMGEANKWNTHWAAI